MPRARKSEKAAPAYDPNAGRRYFLPADAKWGGYIDLKISEDQRGVFNDWYLKPGSLWWDLLAECLADGLALSLKWDAENQCFVVTLTGAGISNSNERYALTARSSDATEAMALCVYKHSVLMGGIWDSFMPRTGTMRSWG